jgi:hypothetical protein
MKAIQKIIIVVYGILVVTVCIYVPWRIIDKQSRLPYFSSPLGYSLIWKIVEDFKMAEESSYLEFSFAIDIVRVILELIAITAVFGTLFVLTLRPKKCLQDHKEQ